MGLGIDVGIDADAHGSLGAHAQRYLVEYFQLSFALNVEAADACGKRFAHFGACLADAREDHLAGITASGQNARQLSA